MALNFPPVDAGDGNPTDGMIWTASNGRQWMYDASIPGWKALAATGNSNIVYRGGIDPNQDPNAQYADIVSGNEFISTATVASIDGALYPGLAGEALSPGAILRYDGNLWQATGDFIPYATELAAGVVELANAAEALDTTNNRVVLTPQRASSLITAETNGFVPDSRQVNAGDGLTGGGNLTTDRTINVGAGDGILVTPSTVDVDSTVVRTTGDQTIGGNKTFTSNVILPVGNKFGENALRKDEIETLIANSTPSSTTYINVKDFGAVGSGSIDDTAAVKAAMDSASNGDTIYFPAGKYRISSTLTYTNKGFRMLGDSQQSILYFVGGAEQNLLELKFSDRNSFWTIENLVFMAAAIPGRQFGAGILLDYTGPATVVGGSDYLNLVNVQIISEITTDPDQGWFKRGLVIQNAGGVNAVNLTISSYNLITSGTAGTEGVYIVNTKAGHSMIRCFHAVNIYIQRYNCCVKSQLQGGTNIESIYITQGEIVGYRGFEIDAGQATFLSGLHMDCQEVAYQNTSNGGPHRIIGCDIRGGRDSAGSNSNYLIKLGANNTTLSGCDILCQMPNEGVIQVAPFGTQPEAISITGNVIEGKDDPNYRALEVNAGAKNIKYGGNSYRRFGGEGRIVNAAGAELVVYGQRTGNTV